MQSNPEYHILDDLGENTMLSPLGFQIIDLFPTNSVFFLFTYMDYSGINLIRTP